MNVLTNGVVLIFARLMLLLLIPKPDVLEVDVYPKDGPSYDKSHNLASKSPYLVFVVVLDY